MTVSSFDDRAATWDQDASKVARAAALAAAIEDAIDLDPAASLLEYGAGTGLVSQHLRGSVGSITLADRSRGMLEVLHAKVAEGIFPNGRVWELDLAEQPAPAERFDLVVTAMTLHHIPDLGPVLRSFADLVREGGHVCVVDLEREDGSFHGAGFDGHDGLDRDVLADGLRSAGFEDIGFSPCYRMTKNGREYDLFLATARRGPVRASRPGT
jgi:ubiquinone/menaquinone biosynthesis C-methylase UbiE